MNSDWFQELQGALDRAGALTGAAECHGNLCGMLCGDPDPDPRPWIEQTLGDADPANIAVSECRDLLERIYEGTRRILEESGTEFHPVLPPDADALEYRVQELGLWCQGFLFGLGTTRSGTLDSLPSHSREVVDDLLEVSRAGLEVDGDDDEQEGAYAEIVEYLRVGVLLIYEELYPQTQEGEHQSRRLH